MATTAKGYPYPSGGDPPDGPTQIHALATAVDATPGIAPLTYAQINALAGAALWTGRRVYQTDTGTNRPMPGEYVYNGVNWRLPWNMPWGVLSVVTVTANEGPFTTVVDMGGVTSTNTFVANRAIRISFDGMFSSTVATDAVIVMITDATPTTVKQLDQGFHLANLVETVSGSVVVLPAAGSQLYKIRAARTAASTGGITLIATTTTPAQFIIEDIGPTGAPS